MNKLFNTNKLLIICGPTATGKTSLGILLAKTFNGEIVSADSRQVYKSMDIGTGKEWDSEVKIWGYDLVKPNEEFSVSKFLRFAQKTISDIKKRGKLPIVVGGTGLYIKGIVDGIPTVDVPINKNLRKNLEKYSPDQLFDHLSQIDSLRAGAMNSSDKKNPRRLIRAIEIAIWSIDNLKKEEKKKKIYDTLFIGLTSSFDVLAKRVEERVDARLKMGFEKEVEKLLSSGVDWNDQSMMSLGYRQWRDYAEGAVEREIAISEWKKEERKYTKRQMTWFRKDMRVNWFDITEAYYAKKVENLVKKWYIVSRDEKS